MRVAIVGTAGRKHLIEPYHWDFMVDAGLDYIYKLGELVPLNEMILVSGGAAGADHVAVWLAMNYAPWLELYLPCEWDHENRQFLDTEDKDWRANPGWLANKYHRKFSESVVGDPNASLNQLHQVMQLSKTKVKIGKGFFDRNSDVAKVDYLLALTRSTTGAPDDGGTLDTWKKAAKNGTKLTHIAIPYLEYRLMHPL